MVQRSKARARSWQLCIVQGLCVSACVCVCACLCKCQIYFTSVRDVVETLALWLSCRKGWSHKAGKSLVLIQQPHKAYTELDLTHCCWIYRLQSSSFILTAHSPRATPVHLFHPHSSCLFLSAFINKQTVTITATFSQHAIVRPSQKPPELPQHTRRENMTDVAWLAGWMGGGADCCDLNSVMDHHVLES